MLQPGQKLFEFEIIRVVGEGGYATVYEAKDRMLERRVAIKELRLEKIKSERAVKRFMQEARVAAALEHPNVITVYALRAKENRMYAVMEYLPGGSLQDLIDRKGKLSTNQAIKYTTGICEGLAKLHNKGIIHRDIKADNILMTPDNHPKITDFGIAHVPQGAGGMQLTRAGFQPSTVIFSSPEQFRGEKLDVRSDVYQVGELLHFMLTGRHYIDFGEIETQAKTLNAKLKHDVKLYMLLEKAICSDVPQSLESLKASHGGLAEVIGKALAKRKEDRYADTLELAADLWAAHFNRAALTV